MWETVATVLKQKNAGLEAKVEELKGPQPKLHGIWNPAQSFWHMGSSGDKPAMQIGGWITLSTSNTNETLYLLTASIDGVQSTLRIDVKVEANRVQDCMVMAFFVPPLETDDKKPFTATIVVEDHKNRKYELPRTTFRATPPPLSVPPPPPNPDPISMC